MKLVTYNILSSKLSGADFFQNCDPVHLKPSNRMNTLLCILEAEVKDNAIICLQEISRDQEGTLIPFFQKHNYTFVTSLYGHYFNGYMGIGIAVPNMYSIKDAKIVKVTDTKWWPSIKPPSLIWKIWDSVNNMIWTKEKSNWKEAQSRSNTMIFLQLQEQKTNFCVATYHMPCAYKYPKVMTIHSALVTQEVQRLAKNLPYVLAGDFNITPSSDQYKLLTTGIMSEDVMNCLDYPNGTCDAWTPEVIPMKSAYMEAHKTEPDFTCHAQVKNQEPFVDCIDYIFFNGMGLENVVRTPDRTDVKGPFPAENQPSDHIPMRATFVFPDIFPTFL